LFYLPVSSCGRNLAAPHPMGCSVRPAPRKEPVVRGQTGSTNPTDIDGVSWDATDMVLAVRKQGWNAVGCGRQTLLTITWSKITDDLCLMT
jgi:hypothetical protein